jgi:2-iminobutanoate/2-iminopropanoate deaminase
LVHHATPLRYPRGEKLSKEKIMSQSGSSIATPPLSKVRRAGNLLFLSGQLPRNAAGEVVQGGIEVQTRQVLSNIAEVLSSQGAGLGQVVKVTAWLTDAAFFSGFNKAYMEFFQEPYPARSTVVSALVMPGANLEIEVVAVLD